MGTFPHPSMVSMVQAYAVRAAAPPLPRSTGAFCFGGYRLGFQVTSLRLIRCTVSSLRLLLYGYFYILFFQEADAFFENHLLGVPVPVMVTAALRACPFPDGEFFHVRVPVSAAAAGLAAREPPGYLEKPPAGPLQLVFHFLEEPVPSG